MFNRRAMIAGVLSIGMAMLPAMPSAHALKPQVSLSNKRKKGLFNDGLFWAGDPLVGTRASLNTVARDKRAAMKRRNQLRNKGRHV